MKKKEKQLCWFFTNRQVLNVVILFCVGFLLKVVTIKTQLHFFGLQKDVQNGDLSVWKMYLVFLLIFDVFSSIAPLYTIFFQETIQRYMQFNLFRRYQRFFRIHEKGVMIAYSIIYNLVNLPVIIMSAGFAIYLVFKTMKMVEYNMWHILIAIIIFTVSVVTGIYRGKISAVKERENSKIFQKKGDLTKYEIFSKEFLKCALYVLDMEYYSRMKMALKKAFFEKFPEIVKQVLYVILVWGLINTLATGEVYSQSYLILTAFSSVISISAEIGRLIEIIISILQMKKDDNLKKLNAFEEKENALLEINKSFVDFDETGLSLSPLMSLNLKSADGREKYYKPSCEIKIASGENAWLIGEKEVGKTRLLTFIKDMFPNSVMIYNDNGKIFNDFRENLKCDYRTDWDLVRRLAKGLQLERFSRLSDDELRKLEVSNINTGDKHLCVVLIMLYYAIKNPDCAKLIILDELLANVDETNSRKILKFIDEVKQEIGCSYVFVGHSQHELIKQYCASCIELKADANTIQITQSNLSSL